MTAQTRQVIENLKATLVDQGGSLDDIVRVPVDDMLMVGDDDHRTPASEAEQFYQALKLRRIDTAMVRIPGASHSINARPSNLLAQVAYTSAWFEKHRAKPAP